MRITWQVQRAFWRLATRMPVQIFKQHTLVALATCMLLACGDGDEAAVSVSYTDVPQLPRNLLSVTLSDGASLRMLGPDEIGAPGRPGPEYATRRRGELYVSFRFATPGGIVSAGEATVPLRSDWRYGFDIRVDSLDPTRLCFGCIGARAFPLAAAYQRTVRDSVWLVWGGNYIRNPVIY